MGNTIYTQSEEIRDASSKRPHVVILGAGASAAAFPHGDRNGNRLPVMGNLVDVLGVGDELARARIVYQGRNFEDVYSAISQSPNHSRLARAIEERVTDYFQQLELPDTITIYDYLVLTLREKDVIATFNWDPFLWLACARNHARTKLPITLFLHGCSIIGFCEADKVQGHIGHRCSKCGKAYKPTRLLFPVANKDYVSDPYIASQWQTIRDALGSAFALTVFGYGAPTTDAAAVDLLGQGWGSPQERMMEQIEIIDILDEEQLRRRWKRFIHTHHYTTESDFFGSLLAQHPRRTCEALWQSLFEVRFWEGNPLPKCQSLDELWEWLGPLLQAEQER